MTVRLFSSSLRILGLSLAVALVGCSGDDTSTSGVSASGSDSDTGSTTDSTTTSTTQTSASGTTTTDSGTGTSDSSTGTTAPETTGETSGSGSTTGDPTTTGTTGDPTTTTGDPTTTTTGTTGNVDENGCAAICETLSGCFPVTLEECMANCEGDFAMADGLECQAATAEVNMCLAGLDCQNFVDEDFAPCADAFVAQDMACMGVPPECMPNKAQMGPNCTVSFDCGMDQFAMQCNTNQGVCTCVENGQEGDTCDNMDFCALDLDAAIQAANDCCGWQF